MKCIILDFREKIRIKTVTRIRIIVNDVTQKPQNGGETVSRAREWCQNYIYTRNHKVTPNNEDLKRKPLLCTVGPLTGNQPQQGPVSFTEICFNGSLCFALFKTAHIPELPVPWTAQPVKLVAGTNRLDSSVTVVQPTAQRTTARDSFFYMFLLGIPNFPLFINHKTLLFMPKEWGSVSHLKWCVSKRIKPLIPLSLESFYTFTSKSIEY